MAAVRAFDLLASVGSALMLRAALVPFVGEEAAWLGALLYPALYLRLGFWGMAQAESYANSWTAVALLAWVRCSGGCPLSEAFRPGTRAAGGHPRSGWSVQIEPADLPTSRPVASFALAATGGLAAAAALLLKVTSLPPLVTALGVASLLRLRREGGSPEARRLAGFMAGLLPPLALVAGAMALSGAGAAYLDVQRGFVTGYVALPSGGAAATGWRYFWHLYSVPAVLAVVGLLAAPNSARLLLGAWLAAAVASVALQRKYFGYHWTPVLQPLAALAGLTLARVLTVPASLPLRGAALRVFRVFVSVRSVSAPQPLVCLLGAAVIAGWSVAWPANGYDATARLLTGGLRRDSYWQRFGRPYHGDFSFLADAWAARYIRSHTRRADPVYIWGFEPLTLFLAERYAPTRFVFAVPLVSPWTPARWREQFMSQLRARPPVLFGVMRHDAIPWASGRRDDSAAQLEQFPELRRFLRRHYRREAVIEDLTLYRRRTPDGAPGAPS
jgi:hypothetical protein